MGKSLGKAVAKKAGAEQQWDFRLGIPYLSLSISHFQGSEGQKVLTRNKTPQPWPGGRRDVAADLRSCSSFIAHSLPVNCNKNDQVQVSRLGRCVGAA